METSLTGVIWQDKRNTYPASSRPPPRFKGRRSSHAAATAEQNTTARASSAALWKFLELPPSIYLTSLAVILPPPTPRAIPSTPPNPTPALSPLLFHAPSLSPASQHRRKCRESPPHTPYLINPSNVRLSKVDSGKEIICQSKFISVNAGRLALRHPPPPFK